MSDEITCLTCGLTGELGVTWWMGCKFCNGSESRYWNDDDDESMGGR